MYKITLNNAERGDRILNAKEKRDTDILILKKIIDILIDDFYSSLSPREINTQVTIHSKQKEAAIMGKDAAAISAESYITDRILNLNTK